MAQQQQQAAAQPLPQKKRHAEAGVAQLWASAGCACGHPHCQEFFGGCADPPGSWGPGCWGPRSPEWEEVWVKELLDAQLALVGEQTAAGVSPADAPSGPASERLRQAELRVADAAAVLDSLGVSGRDLPTHPRGGGDMIWGIGPNQYTIRKVTLPVGNVDRALKRAAGHAPTHARRRTDTRTRVM